MTEPCGQHTIFEPQCRTCARLAALEADRDRLREAVQALLEDAAWSLGRLHPENVARLRAALAPGAGGEPEP